ncbi:Aste57867_10892 [Aphanomyces stellatus]|uniref:Aste57867_10892 protein n=1 Tax=Aphanomyces stellatus TaxID=120398 RepID=A0A485KRH6_9STRA|nr:hypothetical protein As57867_010852 [Aphanomyces stellatus]VFT87760.1 Aste57867_10892 [Aphanomyces stellatus]
MTDLEAPPQRSVMDVLSKYIPSSITSHVSYMSQQALFLFCAFNVVMWFGLYAYFQEKLTINGDAPAELVVMCPQYLIYTVVAWCGLHMKRVSVRKDKSVVQVPKRHSPWHIFAFIAAATFGSYYFSFRALRHVSYLFKVLGKTCKPIPILLLGLCFGKTYTTRKYSSVLLITSGAAVFFVYQSASSSSNQNIHSIQDQLTGVFLLLVSLLCDGLAGVLEDKYIAEYKLGPFDLMFRISFVSTAFCAVLLGHDWTTLLFHLSGDAWRLIGLIGLCGSLGQVFMFISITYFGSLSTSVVGTCRKMLTVLSSIYVFQHPLSRMQIVGLGLAFIGMMLSMASKNPRHAAASAPPQIHPSDVPLHHVDLSTAYELCHMHQRKEVVELV